jgi:hypothetical protein
MKGTRLMLGLLMVSLLWLLGPLANRAVASPTAAPSSSAAQLHAAALDKVRFLALMGTATYAFYQFVYKPFQDKAFDPKAKDRTKSLVKAGAALAVSATSLKRAHDIVTKSNDKALQALNAQLNKLKDKTAAVATNLKQGKFNVTDLQDMKKMVDDLVARAKSLGLNIQQIKTAIPGQ